MTFTAHIIDVGVAVIHCPFNVQSSYRPLASVGVVMMSWAVVSILMTSRKAETGSVKGKFVQQWGCELTVERYHKLHIKLLRYDLHRY